MPQSFRPTRTSGTNSLQAIDAFHRLLHNGPRLTPAVSTCS